VGREGVEPSRCFQRQILSLLRLPSKTGLYGRQGSFYSLTYVVEAKPVGLPHD